MSDRTGWYIVGNGHSLSELMRRINDYLNKPDFGDQFAVIWDAFGCATEQTSEANISNGGLNASRTYDIPVKSLFKRAPRVTVTAYVSYPSSYNLGLDLTPAGVGLINTVTQPVECWWIKSGGYSMVEGKNAITVCKQGFYFALGASLATAEMGGSDAFNISQLGGTAFITHAGLRWRNPVPAGSINLPVDFWTKSRLHYESADLITMMLVTANTTNLSGWASSSDMVTQYFGPIYHPLHGGFLVPNKTIEIVTITEPTESTDAPSVRFWSDARNPNISYESLWTNWPGVMPSVASVVYQMRELSSISTKLDTVSDIPATIRSLVQQPLIEKDRVSLLSATLASVPLPTRDSIHTQFPVESVVYASEIDIMLQPSRVDRLKREREVATALGTNKSMLDVFNENPDVDMGEVDWIAIDRLQKTGMHF